MKDLQRWLALPATILSIVATHAQQLEWPRNLPRTVKYYPEDEAHMLREIAAQERLAWRAPAAVRKMDAIDEGEKFFLGYWGFGDGQSEDEIGKDAGALRSQDFGGGNASMIAPLYEAVAPHWQNEAKSWWSRRDTLRRGFQCPQNTYACSSIGEDDLCCNNGETCIRTSYGVGCCPNGETCGQEVSGCKSGYTACPNSPNGGCCIPGYACKGTGCVLQGTQTVVTTLRTTTETFGSSSTTMSTSGDTVTVIVPTTSISVLISTETVTISQGGTKSTQTVTIGASTACKAGFFSCPASLGGGCCPKGQACANNGQCPDSTTTTTTVSAAAPVLPTSETVTVADASSSTTTLESGCPTGYYMCSAVYLGGCCRVGRDCQTTSCPPQDTQTLLTSGRTVYVTGGDGNAATASAGGSCANGWFNCGSQGNGGCCPSGYSCGVQSCTAAGQRNTAKMAPESAGNVQSWAWSFLGFGIVVGVGMIWL